MKSKAQIKATNKWDGEHYDKIFLTVPKGIRNLVNEHCAALGVSKNRFILELLEREIPEVAREMEVRRSEQEEKRN